MNTPVGPELSPALMTATAELLGHLVSAQFLDGARGDQMRQDPEELRRCAIVFTTGTFGATMRQVVEFGATAAAEAQLLPPDTDPSAATPAQLNHVWRHYLRLHEGITPDTLETMRLAGLQVNSQDYPPQPGGLYFLATLLGAPLRYTFPGLELNNQQIAGFFEKLLADYLTADPAAATDDATAKMAALARMTIAGYKSAFMQKASGKPTQDALKMSRARLSTFIKRQRGGVDATRILFLEYLNEAQQESFLALSLNFDDRS